MNYLQAIADPALRARVLLAKKRNPRRWGADRLTPRDVRIRGQRFGLRDPIGPSRRFAACRKPVQNLRHSGLTWTSPIRPLSFRLRISTLAVLNGAQRQVACQDGSAARAGHLRQTPRHATPTPLARFETFKNSA
jgi:hypothetical protein